MLRLGLLIGIVLGLAVPFAFAAAPSESAAEPPAGRAMPAGAGLSVIKSIVQPTGRTVFYTGESVTFQIVVRNTGTTTVTSLPQQDEYNTDCLSFVPKASPPESSEGGPLIDWYDLTFVNDIDLAPGAVFTTTLNFNVVGPTVAPITGYNTARVTNAVDANNDPVPAAESTVTFTCAQRPSLALDKSLIAPQNRTVLLTGETVSFSVAVTNTGPTALGYIPQQDLYDTSCLTFLPKASPPEAYGDAGLIDWYNLVFDNGRNLPPGQAFTTTMNFRVTGPVTGTRTYSGTNEAQVSGALDVYGIPVPGAQDTVLYTCAAPASIGDYLWNDINGNGLQDEPVGAGLNGVTVRLYQDDGDGIFEPGAGDVLVDTQVTAGDGAYLFDMLFAGTYWVDPDQTTVPSNLVLTTGTDPLKVIVDYGDAYRTADFGYRGADLSIVKHDSADPVAAGGTLSYTLVISNAGPSDAQNVVVTDTLPAGLTFVSATPVQANDPNPLLWNLGTLLVGSSRTLVVTTTVGVGVSGTIYNPAQVSSTTPDPNLTNNTTIEPTLVVSPAIHVEKLANPTVVLAGAQVVYTYTVTNPGDVPLVSVSVTDDKCSPVAGPAAGGDANSNGLLDPGEVWAYTCTGHPTQDTVNTVTATGQPSNPNGQPLPGISPVSDQATASVDVVAPRIVVEKTATPTVIHNGDSVIYTYTVTNPGDVPLANVSLTDDKCSPVTGPAAGGDTNGNIRLDPGEVWTYTCATTLTADTVNIVTATGQPANASGQPLPGIGPVQDQATASVDVLNPAIHVVKTGPAASFVGATAIFTYTVTNIGDVRLGTVTVTDNVCSNATYVSGDANNNSYLDLTEIWTFTCSYVVQPGDPNPLVNIATASGADALGLTVTDQDTWSTALFTVRFGDFAWMDDGDGVQEPGETTGVGGVPVHITGLNALGQTINITVTTLVTTTPGLHGSYMVANLLPGTYTATVPTVFNTLLLSSVGTRTFTLSDAVREKLDVDFGYSLPTSVQLVTFSATPDGVSVRLAWGMRLPEGASKPLRFHVWRSDAGGGWKRLTWDALGPVVQDGVRATYAYADTLVEAGRTYLYQLRSTDGETFGPWQITFTPRDKRVYMPMITR